MSEWGWEGEKSEKKQDLLALLCVSLYSGIGIEGSHVVRPFAAWQEKMWSCGKTLRNGGKQYSNAAGISTTLSDL